MRHPVRSPSAAQRARDVLPPPAVARPVAGRQSGSDPRSRRAAVVVAAALLLSSLAMASCSMPAVQSSDISQGELMLELSDALTGMRSTDADLQAQVDSLRTVVARQDSLLSRLAAVTGVPLR